MTEFRAQSGFLRRWLSCTGAWQWEGRECTGERDRNWTVCQQRLVIELGVGVVGEAVVRASISLEVGTRAGGWKKRMCCILGARRLSKFRCSGGRDVLLAGLNEEVGWE